MRKYLLVIAASLGLHLGAGGQIRATRYSILQPDPFPIETGLNNENIYPPIKRTKPFVITNTSICSIPLGKSGNAFGGSSRPGRSVLDYNIETNALTLIHRSNPASDGTPNSGYFMVDISKDGGTTWTSQQGPIFIAGTQQARYPNGLIFSPSGNIIPDSSYISYHGPVLTGTDYKGYGSGDNKIGNLGQKCQAIELFNTTLNYTGTIPDAGVITSQGTVWLSDKTYSFPIASGDYTDTLLLRKGKWNSSLKCHTWTTTKIPFTATTTSAGVKNFYTTNIAFSKDGKIGYFSALAHNSFIIAPDSSAYLTVWKSIDSGITWSNGIAVPFDCVNSLLGTTAQTYFAGPQLDGTVDMNGNLHLILAIEPSTGFLPGTWGEFSIHTLDQGTTWNIQLLTKPMTMHALFGSGTLVEYNRGQIAISKLGDKIFYVWFDTDTVSFPGVYNTSPDAYLRMYDVTANMWGSIMNLTVGTAVDGLVTFGYLANMAKGLSFPYTLHMGYQSLNGTESQPVDFHYICGIDIQSPPLSPGAPCTVTGLTTDVATDLPAGFSVSDNYPNPTSGISDIEIKMNDAGTIFIEISTLLGQVIYSEYAAVVTGNHKFTIDSSKWNSGVYFYTVKSKDFSVTKKLVVE